MKNTLIIIVGATGVGKTDLCIALAKQLGTVIISADSRQVYRELKIGTAAPTKQQLSSIKHYMVGNKSIYDYYSAGKYEHEVLQLLDTLFKTQDTLILTGGSGMYIDAISKGIDGPSEVNQEIRAAVQLQFDTEGVESLRFTLKRLDPKYYAKADLQNAKRMMKAIEVCLQTGKTHSSFLKHKAKKRPFNILKIGLERERKNLYERINLRADMMLKEGLFEEVKTYHKYKHLNALNTVGYKEFFAHLNGEHDFEEAVRLFKRNSRRYAKRQMTWFKRDKEINWFHPEDKDNILGFINDFLARK